MGIMLGNLSVKQIEDRYQVTFSAEDREWLNEHRQENVARALEKDKWHCFDMPPKILVGSAEFAQELYDRLKNYTFVGQLSIVW